MIVKCNYCNLEFKKKPSEVAEKNYCSRNCMYSHRRVDSSVVPNYRGGKSIRCDFCTKEEYFTPYKISSRKNYFCSKKCRSNWMSVNLVGERATNYKNAKLKTYCQMCDKVFEHWGQRVFCSQDCKNLSQKKINFITCHFCDRNYVRRDCELHWHSERNYKLNFCSAVCRSSHYSGENNPNWIKDRSELKDQNRSIRYSTAMKEWRQTVFKRDDFSCLLCSDRSRKGHGVVLNAHHIKRFADFPDLRFDVNNGVTLCVHCHNMVTGKENEFEKELRELINTTRDEMASRNQRRNDDQHNRKDSEQNQRDEEAASECVAGPTNNS